MNYEIIDMKKWDRRNEYFMFTKLSPGYYSLTADMDITNTYKLIKEHGLKMYPTVIYVISQVVNTIPEFKYGFVKHELVRYDEVHPQFPFFNLERCSCSLLWLPVNDSYKEFHQYYIDYIQRCTDSDSGIKVWDPTIPQNTFTVSMEHRIHFKACSIIPTGTPAEPPLNPTIACGKIAEQNDKLLMPVSIIVNHAVADGYHAAVFYEKVQDMLSNPKNWMDI